MQFISNCALTYERRGPFPVVNKVQFSVSVFEDQRLERINFTVVHDSSSIEAGPSVALFQELEDGESSDKVLSQKAAIKLVTWQLLNKFLFTFCLCNLTELKRCTWPCRDS